MLPDVVVVAETPPSQPSQPLATATVDGETVVRVAEIEAARDVSISEQHTEQTQIMADAAADETDEDVEWLRAELADLRALCATNAGELSSLQAANLTLAEQVQQLSEQVTVLTLAATPPPSTPDPDLSNPPPPPDGNEEGRPEADPPTNPEPPVKKRQRKWL